jgi:hypothetical protein
MPVLSRGRGYLFLMAPRTACTAIGEDVLIPHLDGEYFPPSDVLDARGKLLVRHKHASVEELIRHNVLDEREARSLFKFTTVRNPFDSLVTLYVTMRDRYKDLVDVPDSFVQKRSVMVRMIRVAEQAPFEEWLEHKFHFGGAKGRARRALGIYPAPRHMYQAYIDGADYVMRYESLQEDFNEVQRRLGISEPMEIPKRNVTEGKDHYRAYYTPRARRLVERAFAPDLVRFDYGF